MDKKLFRIASVFLGATVMTVSSVTLGTGQFSLTSSALAAAGGNGNGGNSGGGNGSSNGKSGSSSGNSNSSSTNSNGQGGVNSGKGAFASGLGALNAAHASPKAFLHASPNSEIGKIKAYYLANQAYLVAQATADATDATALQAIFQTVATTADVASTFIALQADPTNQSLVDPYNAALTAANLTPDTETPLLQAAYTDWQNAASADQLAASLEVQMTDALNAAANKKPVSDTTKAALDALLIGKIY